MNPPIKIDVKSDNLHKCELRISGADGDPHVITVPSSGNVYQGLYAVREELERVFNDVLAMHGIVPPPPPSEIPPPVDNSALEAEVAELAHQKAKLDELEASVERRKELEAEKAALEAELAERKHVEEPDPVVPDDEAVTPES